MEVVEHVADMPLFVRRCAEMVKPGGLMITATLNRTLKAFALAIVGAEYVLGWLPRGTHQWDKFVTPNELEIALEKSGLRVIDETGVIYNLIADRWQMSSDMDVNYMTSPSAEKLRAVDDSGGSSVRMTRSPATKLALGAVHRHRRRRADRPQRHPARAHRAARHGGRDPCALPVRVPVRAGLSGRRADRDRRRRCRARRWCSGRG